jgi:hypothetical protein
MTHQLAGTAEPGHDRLFGWILALVSPLALIALANHPVASGGDFLSTLKIVATQIGTINAFVHSALMVMTIVLLFGFYGFARRLGFEHPLVLAGFIAQAVGTVAALGAAVIDGFVFWRIAIAYADVTPDQVDMVRGLYNLAGSIVYGWGRLWLLSLAAAMLLWSIFLVKRQGAGRFLGAFGIIAGTIIIVGTLLGMLPLVIMVTAATFGAIAMWGTAAGILLLRDDL